MSGERAVNATSNLRRAIRKWLATHQNDATGLNAICEQELVRLGDPDALASSSVTLTERGGEKEMERGEG